MSIRMETSRVLREAMAAARPARAGGTALRGAAIVILALSAYSTYLDRAEPISGEQLYALSGLVEQAGTATQAGESAVWGRLFDHFHIKSPIELRRHQYRDAVEFLAGISGTH